MYGMIGHGYRRWMSIETSGSDRGSQPGELF